MTSLAAVPQPGDPHARPTNQEDTVKPYTDADVLDLQDVIADARIRGIGNGTYSIARAILEAGYRLPAEHHRPLLTLDADEVAALRALLRDLRAQSGWLAPALASAVDKLGEDTRD